MHFNICIRVIIYPLHLLFLYIMIIHLAFFSVPFTGLLCLQIINIQHSIHFKFCVWWNINTSLWMLVYDDIIPKPATFANKSETSQFLIPHHLKEKHFPLWVITASLPSQLKLQYKFSILCRRGTKITFCSSVNLVVICLPLTSKGSSISRGLTSKYHLLSTKLSSAGELWVIYGKYDLYYWLSSQ